MEKEFLFENLRNIREDYGYTQEYMAKILQVSRQNYGRWETKEVIIPLKKLNEYCNYFKLNMDYVVGISKQRMKMQNNNVLDKKIIGNNLKEFRKQKNITQKEIASLLNTTQSTISAYEAGKTLILTAFLIHICHNYNLSMDKICERN